MLAAAIKNENWDEFHAQKEDSGMTLEWLDEYVIRHGKRWLRFNGISRVLDLQCGAGRHTAFLIGLGFDVIGCDISEEALNLAQQLLDKNGLEADLRLEDALSLSFEDNYFDAVVAWRSLHVFAIDNIPKALKEMNRVVRPEGRILISTRSDRNILTVDAIKQEFKLHTYLSKEDLLLIINEYFEVEQVELHEFSSDNMQIRNSYWIVSGTVKK